MTYAICSVPEPKHSALACYAVWHTARKGSRLKAFKIVNKMGCTGVAYCNDSTIMAWELLNEPHTSDLYERNNGTACRQQKNGCHAGRLVFDWLAEMSTFVKGLDSNHLVSRLLENMLEPSESDRGLRRKFTLRLISARILYDCEVLYVSRRCFALRMLLFPEPL